MTGARLRASSLARSPLFSGALLGVAGGVLAYFGNPANTGICVSCFLENAAGALGLHSNARMQYMRPELLGFFLGSLTAAWSAREFKPRWRNPGVSLFGLGFLMALGCAAFVGCPIKAVLRLSAGDLTALPGLGGLAAGVWVGLQLLRAGDLVPNGRAQPAGNAVPAGLALGALGLALLVFVPGALRMSRAGGGSLHAPAALSLSLGLAVGALCQRSRFCITGCIRDVFLTRRLAPVAALAATCVGALAVDGFTGQFSVSYDGQPGSHLEWIWSALGMGLVGVAAVVAGGCPFRQIVKTGEGDLDAATVLLGMVIGAAAVQAWGIGATAGGVPAGGKVAVLLGLAAVLALGFGRQKETS